MTVEFMIFMGHFLNFISFGAKFIGPNTGILYNNQMDDFSTPGKANYFNFPASEANYIVPGKRPMSSMGPIIVADKNGDVKLVMGASGGSKIISSLAQVKNGKRHDCCNGCLS